MGKEDFSDKQPTTGGGRGTGILLWRKQGAEYAKRRPSIVGTAEIAMGS